MNLFDTLYNIRLNIAQKYLRKKKISDNFAWSGINEISWERYGQQETDSNLIIENITHVNVHIYKYIKIKVRYDIISLNFILLF